MDLFFTSQVEPPAFRSNHGFLAEGHFWSRFLNKTTVKYGFPSQILVEINSQTSLKSSPNSSWWLLLVVLRWKQNASGINFLDIVNRQPDLNHLNQQVSIELGPLIHIRNAHVTVHILYTKYQKNWCMDKGMVGWLETRDPQKQNQWTNGPTK